MRAGPDANRSAGLQSVGVARGESGHQGLVELACRRSDLLEHLHCCLREEDQSGAVAVMIAPGLTLT